MTAEVSAERRAGNQLLQLSRSLAHVMSRQLWMFPGPPSSNSGKFIIGIPSEKVIMVYPIQILVAVQVTIS